MLLLIGFVIALVIIGMGSMVYSLANSNPYTTQKHSSVDAYYSFIDIREEYGMILKLGSASGAYSPFNSSNTTVSGFETSMTDMMASHGYILNFTWDQYLNNTPPTAEATIQLFDGTNRFEDTLTYNLETGRIMYDLIPPGNITDLNATRGYIDGEIILTWTAVGDDGYNGTAANYKIRKSNQSIDSMEDFENTSQVTPINIYPSQNGTNETYNVTGLEPGFWYFAIVVYDEVGFASNLSNCDGAVAANWTPSIENIIVNDTVVNSSTNLTTERGRNVTIMFNVTDKDREDLNISLWLDNNGSGWYAVNYTGQNWSQYNTTIYNHTIYNINTTWKYYVRVTDGAGHNATAPDGAPPSYYWLSGNNSTGAGVVTVINNSSSTINLSAPYSGDFNNNNSLNVSYQVNGSSTLNYVDSSNITRELLMFKIYISGLNSSTGYNMSVTYNDNEGVYPPANVNQTLLNQSTLP
jgi:hypothetical protein